MQDHFTKWVEGRAVCGRCCGAGVGLKHALPISLHSDLGREFTAAHNQGVCDLLRIAKTYSAAYQPQSNGMVTVHVNMWSDFVGPFGTHMLWQGLT